MASETPDAEVLPDDPFTQLEGWALLLAEYRVALVAVGFTKREAFQLVRAGVRQGWFDDPEPAGDD